MTNHNKPDEEWEDDKEGPQPGFWRTTVPKIAVVGLLAGGAGKIACDATEGARAPKPVAKKTERFPGPPELLRHRGELDERPLAPKKPIKHQELIEHLQWSADYMEKEIAATGFRNNPLIKNNDPNTKLSAFGGLDQTAKIILDALHSDKLPEKENIRHIKTWSEILSESPIVPINIYQINPTPNRTGLDLLSHVDIRRIRVSDTFVFHLTRTAELLEQLQPSTPAEKKGQSR